MYFPTRAHIDARCTRAHTRTISRGTADNERGCLSPFVTAVPASMHIESLVYFSTCPSLSCSSKVSGSLCRAFRVRAPQTTPLYRANSIIGIFHEGRILHSCTFADLCAYLNYSGKIFLFHKYPKCHFASYSLKRPRVVSDYH